MKQFHKLVHRFYPTGVSLKFGQRALQLVLRAHCLRRTLGDSLFKLSIKLVELILQANFRRQQSRCLAGRNHGNGSCQQACHEEKDQHSATGGLVLLVAVFTGQPDLFALEPQEVLPGSV